MKLENLKFILPKDVYDKLPELVNVYKLDTPVKLSHFLSQCKVESGNFTKLRENLNYSADRLLIVFKKYFNRQKALLYAKKPEKIANLVYANRLGNGDENSGDGYKFRGRGYLSLTFSDNYKEFRNYIKEDVVNNPDLVATKYPMESAVFFFIKNKVLEKCNLSPSDDEEIYNSVKCVTLKVNGGVNGLPERLKFFKEFYKLLTN